MLRDDLKKGNDMGCMGVVVHTGKKLKMSDEIALLKMEKSINEFIGSVQPKNVHC